MTREEHKREILELSDDHKYMILNLPTGFGKTLTCLEVIKRHYEAKLMGCNVLVVVPKNVLKDTWKDELIKWDFPQYINVQFTTYVSYYKYSDTYWDCIVFDEAQHFTEACEEATDLFHYERILAVSATIPKEPKWRLRGSFRGIYEYTVSAREAIDSGVLPDPKVLLVPMGLNNTRADQVITIRKSFKGTPVTLTYPQRRQRFNFPNKKVLISCTQQEYYNFISDDIEYKKTAYMQTQQPFRKNQWLHACKERLDWLTTQKEDFVLNLLQMVDSYRTLTFCTSIEQTEKLGSHPVNSKSKKDSQKNLDDFNAGLINHITSANMLNEGVNLTSCQIGIYANIGSSQVVELQRLGRILRHKNPLIVIPFFVGTREEEIVAGMLKNYNEDLVFKLFKSQVSIQTIEELINGQD